VTGARFFEITMRRNIAFAKSGHGALLALAGSFAALLASCSGPLIDRLPTELGGLPADTPQRNPTPPPYPAVHDVPSRPTTPLSDEDQLKLEKELAAARKRQETLQDPTIKERGAAANASSSSAMEKAKEAGKAAAKKKPSEPNTQ
jgi:hypothetical protein